MPLTPSTLEDLLSTGFDTLIDVRSPAEFAEDHIPGAINLPALSNDERAQVGTIYVRESAFRARKIGAALVARNVATHLDGILAEKDGGWRPLVYCWRGGQRSGSVAAILSQIGWRAETISGGYQTYRRMVVRALYDDPWPSRVILLDGNTGVAKTEVLRRLGELGHQVLDLEGLARHRGSLFGGTGAPQPSQKGFETGITRTLPNLDARRPLIVEAESSKIGERMVPPALWKAMQTALRLQIDASLAERARYLVRAYGREMEDLREGEAKLGLLVPFHGHARVDAWRAMLAAGELESLASELMSMHYDPRYTKSRAASGASTPKRFETASLDTDALDGLAQRISAYLKSE